MGHDEGVCGLYLSSLRQGQAASFNANGNEISGVIKGEKFLENLSSFQSLTWCLPH